jgi:hypothetical protein
LKSGQEKPFNWGKRCWQNSRKNLKLPLDLIE